MMFGHVLRGAPVAGLLAAASAAAAADLPSRQAPPPPPMAIETFQPFQIRVRASAVIPDGNAFVYDRYGSILPLVSMSAGAGSAIYGAGAKVSTTVIPELDLSYYLSLIHI